jgi:multifunctional 2-oxoglutarate metabolism enzyme
VQGRFREVLPDPAAPAADGVRRLLLSSGKMYYDLAAHREKAGANGVALARLEQVYPFPSEQILEALKVYPNVREVWWVQEEPENMGAYHFVHLRLHRALPDGVRFDHVAREESGSPATGSATIHDLEQQALLEAAFEGL